jgi:hypothetical protein
MLQPGLLPLGVPLRTRRIDHLDPRRDVIQHHQRHIQRIRQERPQPPHRDQLQSEPEPVVVTTPLRDQIPVRVVQEEEPLQRRLIRRHSREPAVLHDLLISQESGRHDRSTYGTSMNINRPEA